ncbi:MAG: phosphate ABC transporter permease PstA [Alphaproteobacteria bacterium]|nr:phosphate ABC transporter permease PstA [Alphaproteobacteria bacterium]
MTDTSAAIPAPARASPWQLSDATARRVRRRKRADTRFQLYGVGAIFIALAVLIVLLSSIAGSGIGGFVQTRFALDVTFDEKLIDPSGTRDRAVLAKADYGVVLMNAVSAAFPEVTDRQAKRDLRKLFSNSARFQLRGMVLDDPSIVGTTQKIWVPASSDADGFVKDGATTKGIAEADRRLKDRQIEWIGQLSERGAVEKRFNWSFFTSADSREPEVAGIGGALLGSFYTLLITLLVCFPIGVLAAIYLEEFAPKNRLTDLIEVNINNLAAVPSIVFGLLGLAVFIQTFGLPRSAPIVGGLTMALLILPTIIVATRAALKAVPPSIREAAYGVGASPIQVVAQHVVPLAMPGILTGTIIGMARALGETAPLLMIGMVAFIADLPGGPMDAATVLPVQIFLWADSPERGFEEKTAAGTIVLLVFLILMNAIAIYLRKRFEIRW